jgi:hypothetical protein
MTIAPRGTRIRKLPLDLSIYARKVIRCRSPGCRSPAVRFTIRKTFLRLGLSKKNVADKGIVGPAM